MNTPAKPTRLTLVLPPTLAPRVMRAAEMRGLSLEDYLITMLQWHAPAFDNDAQYLKSKVRAVLDAEPAGSIEAALRELVGG